MIQRLFQFTPLREGRPRRLFVRLLNFIDFNSRPSARGDKSSYVKVPSVNHFNSRPSARGDRDENAFSPPDFISIHAPPRGATYFTRFSMSGGLFQFTPLREGRPATSGRSPGTADISIHAPPRGATHGRWALLPLHLHFNSRPSARGDWAVVRLTPFQAISIHAPPRGATPTSSRRKAATTFQFTPLREGRRKPQKTRKRHAHFNSRPSARGDKPRHHNWEE